MYLTYERTSANSPNGLHATLLTSGDANYSEEEICLRTGVSHELVAKSTNYAAIDVVRFAVVDRLVRCGVPMARAAALVRAAESRSGAANRAVQDFPNHDAGVQTGSAMTAGHEAVTTGPGADGRRRVRPGE
ncbi:MAG: hypothetical protein ACRDVE_06580 [Actinocrinis sp.]